jgi:putative membrane protein insertion efficiency factor
VRHALIFLIRMYQGTLASLVGGHCRFYPSCSEYAIEAVRRLGAARGGWLALKRMVRCHPLCEGGVDLVPGRPGTAE